MDRIVLPVKQLNALIKGIAKQTLFPDPEAILTYEDIVASIYEPCDLKDTDLLRSFTIQLQKYIAVAVREAFSANDFSNFVDGSEFSGGVKEGLTSWWRDNRDTVLAQAAARQSTTSGPSDVTNISWLINTKTASSATENGDVGSEPQVSLEISRGSGGTLRCNVSKEVLADVIQQFARIRKELERLAATS